MPTYKLKCIKCGEVIETSPVCTYSKAKEIKCECGSEMKINPQTTNFKIHGYSEENGYHRETIDYAKGVIG